jgi:hypothetical protein
MMEAILVTLALRFFLFDFVLFKSIRVYLQTHSKLCKKFLGCPFCQGFWTGLGVWFWDHGWLPVLPGLRFAFVMGFLCLSWSVIFDPLIRRFEERHGVPLT